MKEYLPQELSVPEVQRLLQGGIGPRPIALVSTISKEGINNLSPFSFFNVFGANPPVIAFSPSRRGRDGSLKDTYLNLMETKECVVQAVNYSMVEQISLASTEYERGVDEFVKSGLTPIDSHLVKPKRVKESPFQMECKLLEMKSYGNGGASANIAICEVIIFHVKEDLFVDGLIHPNKIDLVARMSGDFYCRAFGENIFEVEKPIMKKGIGFDQIPGFIKQSNILTANNLGKLGNIESIPDMDDVTHYIEEVMSFNNDQAEYSLESYNRFKKDKNYNFMLNCILNDKSIGLQDKKILFEETAQIALELNKTETAWKILLFAGSQ
ncbi:MAG: flavin reductase family protein [Ignavibacterium sp.]|jgi:flavin reductase (DIM6/NTAB) family NADH-FMN oxidoreductase RutF|nr:flavin reductase family protein [Ignavibacterium sp.]